MKTVKQINMKTLKLKEWQTYAIEQSDTIKGGKRGKKPLRRASNTTWSQNELCVVFVKQCFNINNDEIQYKTFSFCKTKTIRDK